MGNYIKFESVLGVQDQVGFIFVEFADDFFTKFCMLENYRTVEMKNHWQIQQI